MAEDLVSLLGATLLADTTLDVARPSTMRLEELGLDACSVCSVLDLLVGNAILPAYTHDFPQGECVELFQLPNIPALEDPTEFYSRRTVTGGLLRCTPPAWLRGECRWRWCCHST